MAEKWWNPTGEDLDQPRDGETQEDFLHRVHVVQQRAPMYRPTTDTCRGCNPSGYLEARNRERLLDWI